MAATYSIIDIELRSDMAIQYTKVGRVPLVFRRPRRVHFRNDHHLVIPGESYVGGFRSVLDCGSSTLPAAIWTGNMGAA